MPEQEQVPSQETERVMPTLTSKCHPDELRVIDVAASLVGKPRSHFMLEATLAAAKEVLAAHNIDLPLASAAA
ncbi:MAG: DUF1778 domain-containing protein [Gemmatimonadales bacterium]